MMDITIERLTSAPDREQMNALLSGYYTGLIRDLISVGGPAVDPALPIADFWDHLDEFMPPEGCLLVARNGDDWLGTGALRRLPDNRGELKRLYVCPKARGTGLGRRLVTERMDIAREMGLQSLHVDTFTTTREMQALYASLGFVETGPYPEAATYVTFPEVRAHLLFFKKDLTR